MKERAKKYSKEKMWTKVLFEFSGSGFPGMRRVWGKSRSSGQQPDRGRIWWRPGTPFGCWASLGFAPHTSFPGELLHCLLSLSRCHWPTALSSPLLLILSAHSLWGFRGLYFSLDCWLSLFFLLSKLLKCEELIGLPSHHSVESHHSV